MANIAVRHGAPYHRVTAGTAADSAVVKAGAGIVKSIQVGNIDTAPYYLKLYDKATAPVVGTDVPVMTICMPGATAGTFNVLNFQGGPEGREEGIDFQNGIAIGISTGAADTDTGAPTINKGNVNIVYK